MNANILLHNPFHDCSQQVSKPLFVFWSFQMSGLKFRKQYKYRVFAENAAGVSDASNVIGPILADDPHCKFSDVYGINLFVLYSYPLIYDLNN